MNRRFTALVLVLSMLVCVFPVFAADEALPAQQAEPQYDTEAYELLKYLQIVELEPEALSGGITRGQFLKSLDILVGYGTYTSQEQLFSDMTPDDPYAPYINMLAKSGFIQGFPDGTIRLSSSITLEEATRLLLKAIGWDYFANANTTSGQYYSQAQSAELLDGVTAGWAETIAAQNSKEFIGDKGRIRITLQADRCEDREEGDLISWYRSDTGEYRTINSPSVYKNMWQQLLCLIDMIEGKSDGSPTLEDAYRAFRIALLGWHACEQNTVLPVPEEFA